MSEEKKSRKEHIMDMLQFEAVGEHRSSFNFKSTSKGNTVEVKIYSGDSDEDITKARQRAEKDFDELKAKYKPIEA